MAFQAALRRPAAQVPDPSTPAVPLAPLQLGQQQPQQQAPASEQQDMDTAVGSQKRPGMELEPQGGTARPPKVFVTSAEEPWGDTELIAEAKTLEAAQWQAA